MSLTMKKFNAQMLCLNCCDGSASDEEIENLLNLYIKSTDEIRRVITIELEETIETYKRHHIRWPDFPLNIFKEINAQSLKEITFNKERYMETLKAYNREAKKA